MFTYIDSRRTDFFSNIECDFILYINKLLINI